MSIDATRQARDGTAARARSAGSPSRKGPHRRLDRAGRVAKSDEKVAQPRAAGVLPELPPAIEPSAGLPRWVGWKIVGKTGEKPRKLPINAATGKAASSTDPATWAPFAKAKEAVSRHRLSGVGITLGDLGDGRWLIGLDLDLCRSPVTGEIRPWAREKIDRWNTYGETSPSSTGVKLFGYTTRPIEVPVKEITVDAPIPEGAEGPTTEARDRSLPERSLLHGDRPGDRRLPRLPRGRHRGCRRARG